MSWRALRALFLVAPLAAGCHQGSTSDGADAKKGPSQTRATSLVQPLGEASDCPNGGVELKHGIDSNADGTLDPSEVDGTYVVCHGRDGATSYNDLEDKPDLAGFLTAETDPHVNSLGRAALSCASGSVPKYDGAAWICSFDATLSEVQVDQMTANNGYLSTELDPSVNALGKANLSCPAAATVSFDGSQWVCTDLAAVATSGNYADLAGLPVLYTDGTAVAAMGAVGNGNPLNHDRYSDAEAISAMGTKAATNALHHNRYTDAEAVSALAGQLSSLQAQIDALAASSAVHSHVIELYDDGTVQRLALPAEASSLLGTDFTVEMWFLLEGSQCC